MTGMFSGGIDIAMKVPPHQFEVTVAFYRDVIGLPPITDRPPATGFELGPNRLWIDEVVQMSQAEIWLELYTEDFPQAAEHLKAAGVVRCDPIEPLPEGFRVAGSPVLRASCTWSASPTPGSREMHEAQYRRDGFVVLRDAFDAPRLTAEVLTALEDGFAARGVTNVSAEAAIEFRYLPLMSERAPYSLELLRDFAARARQLLNTDVLPVRAKAVEYHGSSSWHRDSDADVASVGFACYLESVTATSGALRVVPGSHRHDEPATSESDRDAVAIETAPGDVIVFDEHLLHSSTGGVVRHQWRVDYVARPVSTDEQERVGAYFAAMFSPDWDGGYDVDRYPTYGAHWRRSCPPADDQLLEVVGAYAAADEQEAAARRRRGAIGAPPRRPRRRPRGRT